MRNSEDEDSRGLGTAILPHNNHAAVCALALPTCAIRFLPRTLLHASLRPASEGWEGVAWLNSSRRLSSRALFCAFQLLKRRFVSNSSQAAATPEPREKAEPYFQLAFERRELH